MPLTLSDIQGLACIVRQTMDPLARRVERLEAKVENLERNIDKEHV